MTKGIKLLYFFICTALLQSCVQTDLNTKQNSHLDYSINNISQGYGGFVLRVIRFENLRNPKPLAAYTNHPKFIEIEQLNTNKIYKFKQAYTHYSSTTLYLGSLPPGQYQLKSIPSSATSRIHIPSNRMTFKVNNGTISNLASLLLIPNPNFFGNAHSPTPLGNIVLGEYATLIVNDHGKNIDLIAQDYPQINNHLNNSSTLLGWDKPMASYLIERFLLENTPLISHPRLLPNKSIIAGSLLGQIFIRNTQGHWHRVNTGEVVELRSVYQSNNKKQLIAAGEESVLTISENRGISWQRLNVPLKKAIFEYIGKLNNNYILLAMKNRQAHVFMTNNIKANNWRLIYQSKVKYDYLPEQTLGIATNGRHFAFHDNDGQWHIYHANNHTWRSVKTGFQSIQFMDSQNNQLFILARSQQMDLLYASDDFGYNWYQLPTQPGRYKWPYISRNNRKFIIWKPDDKQAEQIKLYKNKRWKTVAYSLPYSFFRATNMLNLSHKNKVLFISPFGDITQVDHDSRDETAERRSKLKFIFSKKY